MRIVALLILILFVAGVAGTEARADEADPFLTVSEAKPIREQWQACTAAAVKRDWESSRPAEAIAERALSGCKTRETALVKVLARRLGRAAARRIVTNLRDFDRLVLTRIIERLRGK
jgi:hypothetical protein